MTRFHFSDWTKFYEVKKPHSYLVEMNPSSSRMNPFDPFLDSLQIRYKYDTKNTLCSTIQEIINVRSILYRKGEYVGYTRVAFGVRNGKVIANSNSMNIGLRNFGRCRDTTTLLKGKSKTPRYVSWRIAKRPYAVVQFSNSLEHAKFDCSDGEMVLEDWHNTINSTEITHIRVSLMSKMPTEWTQCIKVYFKIKRGKEPFSYSIYYLTVILNSF
jgi:hypothetical protein